MTGKHSGHTSVRRNDGGTPLREQVTRLDGRFGWGRRLLGAWAPGSASPEPVRLPAKEAIALELRDPERCAQWRKIVKQA